MDVKFNGFDMNKSIGDSVLAFLEGDYKTMGSSLGSGLAEAVATKNVFLF
jgi:hypothetical protein